MADVEAMYGRIKNEAERRGYRLNPDEAFVKSLIEGLMSNGSRYGYESCPCRLSTGKKDADLDIICPCDYRDPDIDKYGACYCGLYVSEKVYKGEQHLSSIPESRPPPEARARTDGGAKAEAFTGAHAYPVWRCKVCGYLCARDSPPDKCPICNVSKERFERFM
jgi:ferredoxin-thioredoxin reductase catalytic subunit/rubredoxin